MSEVRQAVQRALDKLLNRFGKQSEVIDELRLALDLLQREERPASSKPPEPSVVAAPEEIQQPAQAEQKADDPGSKPQGRIRRVKRGN